MKSAAPLMIADHSSFHRNSISRISCPLVTAFGCALHVQTNGIVVAEVEKMVSYK